MCCLKSSFLYGIFSLILVSHAYTQVSKDQAITIVMDNIVFQDSSNYNVYMLPDFHFHEDVNLSPYDVIENPYDTAWLFFIDLMPEYGWGHSCKYVFIQKSTGNYSILNTTIHPINYWRNWEEVSVPFKHQIVVQSMDTNILATYQFIPDPHKYAMLVTWDAWDDTARWNNLSHVYSGLKQTYGILDENIFVLSDDGIFPDTVNLNLDGLFPFNDFDGPCTKEKIVEIFDYLDTAMTSEDIFLFYATTHGEIDGYGQDTTYLRLNDYEPLFDYELAEMVDDLICSQMIFIFDVCNAGGMLDNLEDDHRVVQVPVPWGMPIWRHWRYFDRFTYGWATAVRGFHPAENDAPWESGYPIGTHPHLTIDDTTVIIPDTMPDLVSFQGNGDGFIQFGEAFNYAKYLSYQTNTYGTDYQNHGFTGDLLTLNGIEGRVDTSQAITGNFLIGRKLTLAPEVVLSDYSNAQNPLNLYLNDSTQILVQDSATLNINGYYTKFIGCSGQSFVNIEGDVSSNYMNFEAGNGATINMNFINPDKNYDLNAFNFENASIHASCNQLKFSTSDFDNTLLDFSGGRLELCYFNQFSGSDLEFTGTTLKITNNNEIDNSNLFIYSGTDTINESNDISNAEIEFSGDELYILGPNNITNSALDLANGNINIEDGNSFVNSSIAIHDPLDEASFIDIIDNSFDNDSIIDANACSITAAFPPNSNTM